MKSFNSSIVGFQVTNENFVEVAKQIADKYGVCPALNSLVLLVVSNLDTTPNNKKDFFKAVNSVIKGIGYSPKYFNSQLSKIGSEYCD